MTLSKFLWASIVAGLLGWAAIFASIGAFVQAVAGETWVSASGVSRHLGTTKNYNENNWGVGIERSLNEDWRLMAGTYHNSYRRDTVYAGFGYTPIQFGPAKLGVVAGLFSGYVKDVTPVVMGVAMVEWKGYGLNVLFLPPYKDFSGLVAFQVKAQWR